MSSPISPISDATSATRSRSSAHSIEYLPSSSSSDSLLDSSYEIDDRGFLKGRHRAGGPVVCSLPAQVAHFFNSDLQDKTREMFSLADSVLVRYRLQPTQRYLCGRLSCINPEPAPITTLFLVMPHSESETFARWRPAAIEMHSRAQTKIELRDISIEFIDEKLMEPTNSFPVEPSHPIHPKWMHICHTIARDCNLWPWLSVSCLRYGRENQANDNPVSVIISVPETVESGFRTDALRIQSILFRNTLFDVDVLFLKNDRHPCAEQDEIGHVLPIDACSQHVLPGVSMGIRASDAGSSTLGGIVELSFAGQPGWQPFGLTCFHCIYPPENNRKALNSWPGARQQYPKWEFSPVYPNEEITEDLLKVEQPSTPDLVYTISHIDSELQSTHNSPKFQKSHKLAEAIKQGSGDFMLPKDEFEYKHELKMIRILEERKRTFELFLNRQSNVLGSVFCGSGVNRCVEFTKTRQKRLVDWALVRIDEARLPKNKSLVNINKPFPYSGEKECFQYFKLPESKDPIEDGEILLKTGRTTGETSGRYSGLKEMTLLHEKDPGSRRGYRTVSTWTDTITFKGGNQFCEKGDSGSLVRRKNGEVVGLFFGAADRSNVAYLTEIFELFGDIKSISKATDVRFPIYGG